MAHNPTRYAARRAPHGPDRAEMNCEWPRAGGRAARSRNSKSAKKGRVASDKQDRAKRLRIEGSASDQARLEGPQDRQRGLLTAKLL